MVETGSPFLMKNASTASSAGEGVEVAGAFGAEAAIGLGVGVGAGEVLLRS